MKLSEDQLNDYKKNGFLFIENVFSEKEISTLLTEMERVIEEDSPRKILEKNGQVRSFFAPELSSPLFENVVRLDRLVSPSRQLIGSSIYKHQTKLNTKHAIVGDWWDWHQDYTYWKKEDGMPSSDVLTAMIYLNDVNEFNGPLFVIPGSHTIGTVDATFRDKPEDNDEWFEEYQTSTTYMSALTADLKYTIPENLLADWITKKGLISMKGKAGSVLFFHGNLFHASTNNLSPWNRHTFLITYNSTNNSLPDTPNPRPEFISSRDFSAIECTEKDFILP
ncbi:MAG: phytanoyl-CoA dioxygenase family protein [Fluviicola sp.]|nr:phytanoyl-CoA dioxygenase family protein [Fluviicola sp.]